MVDGFCMKCKVKREMVNASEVVTPNKKKAVKGQCNVCGTNMYKIIGKA